MLTELLPALVLAAIAIAAVLFLRNRAIRRRMVFTLLLVAALAAFHTAGAFGLLSRLGAHQAAIELLILALATINTLVAVLLNPWFSDRVPDRAPAIVQDALVIGGFLLVSLFVLQQDAQVFATSAITAAVLGFALQETLGNAFAGLAIQTEKPFRVGHWIAVAGYEGRVMEVTWRATKIRTKAGNLVVLPNNVVAREAINNYTEPSLPTRMVVEVGASYDVPPNEVRAAIFAAIRQSSYALATPEPDVLLADFAASSITYRARFWIEDFAYDEISKADVRRGIYYEFLRRHIEIPYPIQVEYSRQLVQEDPDKRAERFAALITRVPVLATVSPEGQQALARASHERLFGNGEVIVREGEPGSSMFVVDRGEVAVVVSGGREVARIKDGGYFGEMSLLTGDPRTATVRAVTDCAVLEISADTFRAYVTSHPEVIEQLAAAAAARRRELDETRAAAASHAADMHLSIAKRMRRFFGLEK